MWGDWLPVCLHGVELCDSLEIRSELNKGATLHNLAAVGVKLSKQEQKNLASGNGGQVKGALRALRRRCAVALVADLRSDDHVAAWRMMTESDKQLVLQIEEQVRRGLDINLGLVNRLLDDILPRVRANLSN